MKDSRWDGVKKLLKPMEMSRHPSKLIYSLFFRYL